MVYSEKNSSSSRLIWPARAEENVHQDNYDDEETIDISGELTQGPGHFFPSKRLGQKNMCYGNVKS